MKSTGLHRAYTIGLLPGVATFGLGMAITVAPLTAAVLGSVDDEKAGVASGVNNAMARFAGLIAVAALPALAGVATEGPIAESIDAGYGTAVRIAAVTTAIGGIVAALVVGQTAPVRPTVHPAVLHACNDAALRTGPVALTAPATTRRPRRARRVARR